MSRSGTIDQAIAPLASRFHHCADDLLDIREAAMRRRQPGKCVACFYKVMGMAGRRREEAPLEPLKSWIEEHLEIVAEDECEQRLLERMPVRLRGDDLESYCRGVMAEIHHDRNYASRNIALKFAFKDSQAA